MGDDRKIKGAVDRINNLPDVILQHILCFVPTTKVAISTSLLSRRWRHLWCEVPSISLDVDTLTAASVNETLTRYTAPMTKSFHLILENITENIPYIDRLIKFAMSHNFENLSLDLCSSYEEFKLPDFFYSSDSFKQLKIYSHKIVPYCTVSWTSLQKLSLRFCRLSDESMSKIISGCPVLENLTLYDCYKLKVLDLSKSLRLRTLLVHRNMGAEGPRQIVAPHIHCLRLLHSQSSCTLVDVASLTEAKLDICYALSNPNFKFKAEPLQVMVLKNLEKLQNAEKLTFGGNFVKILSLAEICGVPFPILKVKSLTLDTVICKYVIPGIERLLQNSPDLEKLIVRGKIYNSMPGEHLDQYLKLKSLSPDQCWKSKDGFSWNKSRLNVQPKHVTSFMELVLKNTEKLDKIVVLLDERYLTFKIEYVIPTLPHNSNVTIVLSSTNKPMASEEW